MKSSRTTLRLVTGAACAAALIVSSGCSENSGHAQDTPTTAASTPLDYDAGNTPPPPASTPYMPQATRTTAPLPTVVPSLPPATPGRPGTPRGLPRTALHVDRADALSVALGFAALLTAHDTRIDNRPADAGRRAARLATPALARQLLGPPPAGSPGADWLELQRHHGYTKVAAGDATESGAPADTATDADRAISIRSTPVGPGWTGAVSDLTVFIHLTRGRAGASWSVTGYSVQ